MNRLFMNILLLLCGLAALSNLIIKRLDKRATVKIDKNVRIMTLSNNKFSLNNQKRVECISSIRRDLVHDFSQIIPKNRPVVLLDAPSHQNYGDTMILLGELELLKALNLSVKFIVFDKVCKRFANGSQLEPHIGVNDTILMHGGGNFGDLYNHSVRNRISRWLENRNMLIFMPQTINYKNMENLEKDREELSTNLNLIMTFRSMDAYEFASRHFKRIESALVADTAFMMGDMRPLLNEPLYDILILRRNDLEAKFGYSVWRKAINKFLLFNYTYLNLDWFDVNEYGLLRSSGYYKHEFHETKATNILVNVAETRKKMMLKIISQARVIITDRLHGSVAAFLAGRPHVIVDDKYKKVYNTRSNAFKKRPECDKKYLRYVYAKNPSDAVKKAVRFLQDEQD